MASPRSRGESRRYQPDAEGTLRRGSPCLHPPSGVGGQKPWALSMPPPQPTQWRGVPEHRLAPGTLLLTQPLDTSRGLLAPAGLSRTDSPGHWGSAVLLVGFFFPNELTTVGILEDHHVSAVASSGSMHTHAFTTRFSPAHISVRTPCVCLLCHLIMKLPAVNRKTGGAQQTLESGDCSLGASSHV